MIWVRSTFRLEGNRGSRALARVFGPARIDPIGQNAPAIAATEADYEEMWAQDVVAMADYHGGASAAAAQLAPWQKVR